MLITADHGNAEMMIDPATGGPHTAHTTNPVPFIVVAEDAKQFTPKAQRLAARYFSDHAGNARRRRAERNDGKRICALF